jgi:hypothetical protein
MIYPDPAGKWIIDGCPMAPHVKKRFKRNYTKNQSIESIKKIT